MYHGFTKPEELNMWYTPKLTQVKSKSEWTGLTHSPGEDWIRQILHEDLTSTDGIDSDMQTVAAATKP